MKEDSRREGECGADHKDEQESDGREEQRRRENKLQSSQLIVLSYFDVSAPYTMCFYHFCGLLLNTTMMAEDYICEGRE